METIRQEMINNICSYNRYQSKSELSKLSNKILLANCHPIEREEFIEKLRKLKKNESN